MCSQSHPLSSKQITSCAIFNRPVHALLSLQGITAPARTLSKRARNCSAWTLSDPSRTLYECFEGSLTAAALGAIARTLYSNGCPVAFFEAVVHKDEAGELVGEDSDPDSCES